MRLKNPIFLGLILLILGAYILSLFNVIFYFARIVLLILAIGNTVHSIEEYFTQFWIESPNSILPIFHNSTRTQSQLDGPLFIMISLYFNGVNWLMLYLLLTGVFPWVNNYILILLGITILNGIIHLVPVIKNRKYNSGVISILVTIIVVYLPIWTPYLQL
jgi:hypothetical protein